MHVGSSVRSVRVEFPWALLSGAVLTAICVAPVSFAAWQEQSLWLSHGFYKTLIVLSWALLFWRAIRPYTSALAATSEGSLQPPKRAPWQSLDLAFFTFIIIQGCKFVIQLPRPSGAPNGFISGHTAYAMGLAWLVGAHYPRLMPFWFGAAAAIGWARIASNAHYPYQVFIGLLTGTALGWLIVQRETSFLKPIFSRKRTSTEKTAQPAVCSREAICAPRSRLRLTGLGGIALLFVSWKWGQAGWLPGIFPLGVVIALCGLALRVWATGWLVKNETLTTSGPYAFTRNPLYLGTLLITLGQSLMSDVAWAPLFFPALCLALYWPTMRQEEQFLRGCYGAAYDDYARRVPLLFPHFSNQATPYAEPTTQSFAWRRVRRCYKGFIANALVILVYALLHIAR